ncbi:MAG: sulfotransferase family protein [Nocardioidaceae bacterium]
MSETLTRRALRAYFPSGGLRRRVVPLPEHGLVYVKNPKAGSSTLMVWLHRLHSGDPAADPEHMHRDHQLPSMHEVGRDQVLRMLSGDAYRFSFVRNPVRRLESVYRGKICRHHSFRRRVAPTLGLPPDPSEPVSFEQFLAAVERQDPLTEMDPHWRPQHLNLLHPLVSLDCVGRLESFEADLERIRLEAGLPRMPADTKNAAPARQTADSVYDGRPDLRRRVETLFAVDMELYGY